jgi:hypothetical protein
MTINRHKPLQSPDHVQFATGSQGGMKHVCRCLCSGIVVGLQQPAEATEVCCGETPPVKPPEKPMENMVPRSLWINMESFGLGLWHGIL